MAPHLCSSSHLRCPDVPSGCLSQIPKMRKMHVQRNPSIKTNLKIKEKWLQKRGCCCWWRVHSHRNMQGMVKKKKNCSEKRWCVPHQGVLFWGTTFVASGFHPREIKVAFPRKSQPQQSHTTQPTVHSGWFSVSIMQQTLIRTTRSLMCAQVLMHVIAHGGVQTHPGESALRDDSGRKISCHTWELNLHQRHAGPMLYQLSYIPTPGVPLY